VNIRHASSRSDKAHPDELAAPCDPRTSFRSMSTATLVQSAQRLAQAGLLPGQVHAPKDWDQDREPHHPTPIQHIPLRLPPLPHLLHLSPCHPQSPTIAPTLDPQILKWTGQTPLHPRHGVSHLLYRYRPFLCRLGLTAKVL
jgi:hypothetical protein